MNGDTPDPAPPSLIFRGPPVRMVPWGFGLGDGGIHPDGTTRLTVLDVMMSNCGIRVLASDADLRALADAIYKATTHIEVVREGP